MEVEKKAKKDFSEKGPCFTGMNKYILETFLTYLDFRDILNISCCCKGLNRAAKSEAVWRELCQTHLFMGPKLDDARSANQSYLAYFIEQTQKIKEVRRILDRNVALVKGPRHIYDKISFDACVRGDKLKTLMPMVREMYTSFPAQYLNFYRVLNGQEELTNFQQFCFGGFKYYGFFVGFTFNCFERQPCHKILQKQYHIIGKVGPLNQCGIMIDTQNTLGYGNEAVFSMIVKGNLPVHQQEVEVLLLCSKFDEFIQHLSSSVYNPDPGYIDHFNTVTQPMSDVTTKGVRVRTDALFVPWDPRGSQDNFLYAYQIRISSNNMQRRVKLTRRKWRVECNGEIHNIVGEGVIGYYPEVYPGSPDFVYESCIPLVGKVGMMGGFLEFQDMDTHELFDVEVGNFPLRPRPGQVFFTLNRATDKKVYHYQ